MKDPFGHVLAILKADAGILALVAAGNVSSEFTSTPCVWLSDLSSTNRPFGPNSGRLGLQGWAGVAKCYASDTATGAILARQIAGAVVDALDLKGPRYGSSDRYIAQLQAPEMDGMERDPDTRYPHYDVVVNAIAAKEAVVA